jgi:DNA-binding NtrC family response regulator
LNKKILFIDDNEVLLQTIEKNLKNKYKDVIADFESNAKKVITNLNKLNYDIVVTDYKMPDIDGGKLLKMIKRKHPDIIGIILTGHLDEALKSKIKDPDIFFLEKPFSVDEIMQTIEIAYKIKQ